MGRVEHPAVSGETDEEHEIDSQSSGFIQTCRHIGKRKKKDVGKGNEGCVGSQQTAPGCD